MGYTSGYTGLPEGMAGSMEITGYDPDPYDQALPYDPDPYDQTDQNRNWQNPTFGYDQDPYDQTDQNRDWDGNYHEDEGQPMPGGGGGGDWSWLQKIISGGTDAVNGMLGGGGIGGMAQFAAALAASKRGADEMNEAAGRYEQAGERAAGMADPWGNDQRKKFQGKLDTLLADPTSSPVYQSMMREAMNSLGPKLASQGRAGSEAGGGDWMRLMGDVSNKFTGEWADRYGKFGGADVNPAEAARMIMEGTKQAGAARESALAARLYPYGMLAGGANGPGGGGPGGGGPGGGGPGGSGSPINDIIKTVKDLVGKGTVSASDAMSLVKMLGSGVSSVSGLFPGGAATVGLEEQYGDILEGNWDFDTDFGSVNNLPIADNDTDYGSIGGGGSDYFTPDDSYLTGDYSFDPSDFNIDDYGSDFGSYGD